MNQVSTTTNAAGALTPRPALARGVAVSSGLRSLMDLVQSDQPPEQAAEWRGTAIVSVLGQLAATAPATSEQLLNSCCGVAKQRRSVAGIEPILLSALLGAPEQSPSLAIADATWAALPAGHFADDELFPILDPIVGDVCFLSGADIGSLTGLALRAQLAALCNSHATAAGAVADETSFAAAVLLAAATVVSAALLAPLSDSSPQKSAALAALPANGDSGGLPPALVRGGALFVQTCLIKDNGDTFGPPTQPWKSLWPRITTLRAGDPAEAVRHPYWKPSQLCPALPTTGPGLTGKCYITAKRCSSNRCHRLVSTERFCARASIQACRRIRPRPGQAVGAGRSPPLAPQHRPAGWMSHRTRSSVGLRSTL